MKEIPFWEENELPAKKAETLGSSLPTLVQGLREYGFSSQQAHFLQKQALTAVELPEKFFEAGPSAPLENRWQARQMREEMLDQQLKFCERFQCLPLPQQEVVLMVVAHIPGDTAALFVQEAFDYYPGLRTVALALLVFRLVRRGETEHIWRILAWLREQRS